MAASKRRSSSGSRNSARRRAAQRAVGSFRLRSNSGRECSCGALARKEDQARMTAPSSIVGKEGVNRLLAPSWSLLGTDAPIQTSHVRKTYQGKILNDAPAKKNQGFNR